MDSMKDSIIVLDFGAQYSQLIARRVRELNVYSQIVPFSTPAAEIRKLAPRGLIFSGGPCSVSEPGSPRPDSDIFSLGIPILGICYGLQVLAIENGAEVSPPKRREYGLTELKLTAASPLLKGMTSSQVWMSHGDSVSSLPAGFRAIARTENCELCAIEDSARKLYGVQFHPEVVHSVQGKTLLRNFVRDICGCEGSWTMASFIDKSVAQIKSAVGDRQVLCGLSGGVDSSVAAALIHRAIGDNLVCVFVNNGLLRKNEPEMVQKVFKETFKMRFCYEDASSRFLDALRGITEPEAKRKTIGRVFIDAFYDSARQIEKQSGKKISFLAQGTLYPDVIESKSPNGGPSATIKSHHNVGGLPSDLKWELLEPLCDLFKDEVRSLGRELGLPAALVDRHPFPGPGLGVRCIGEVTQERLDTLREVDAIFIEEIRDAGLYSDMFQAFADLLPVKSVGVQGDGRTYKEVCTLRAVTSEDAMTADWYHFEPEFLTRVANRICNEVSGVNRVLFDITQKPPGTIEWE
ncbi:MAG: glutamine-hydrolyzing GMP synthase [Sphaerochaetaceae bacterium]